jgi:hypothetical protein
MRSLFFLIALVLTVTSAYSQSKMSDRELDGLTGPVKSVKVEWKEITTFPGRDLRNDLIFISEDYYAETGQVTEELGENDYKAIYSTIDGFKTAKFPPSPTTGNKFTIIGKVDNSPIEIPERLTDPDPRFDLRFTYEYDDLGRVKTERLFESNGKLQRLQTFKYAANGKVSVETTTYTTAIITDTYTYDQKGFLIESLRDSYFKGASTHGTRKTIYSEYRVDSHGNWISRRVQVLDFGQGSPEQKPGQAKYDTIHIEYRTITYY